LLEREFLRPIRIDPLSHPTGRPHSVVLRFVAGDDGSRISSNSSRKVVLDKGVDLSVLQYHILERIAHVTYASKLACLFATKGHRRQTALIECVTRTIPETI